LSSTAAAMKRSSPMRSQLKSKILLPRKAESTLVLSPLVCRTLSNPSPVLCR
jgi:hypothetical protein